VTTGLRYVAPSGAPIRLPDLARWASIAVSSRDASEDLRRLIRDRFAVPHCELTSTGRAGMTLLLRALRRLAPGVRDEVVVPSYTCYSVGASVVKAGLKLRVVDISEDTLDYSSDALQSMDLSRTLAIVATNLYGLPNDMASLSALARRSGAFLIDDAAQAMGGSFDGRWCGTWGDAGLFSFDKGKNVSAIDGGLVVTNSDDVAEAMRAELAGCQSAGLMSSGVHVAKALAYFTMLRPSLYSIPTRIPQLALGKTVYDTEFPLHQADSVLMALGLVMMRRLDEFTNARRANAAALLAGLKSMSGLASIAPRARAVPVYLRLPVLFSNGSARDVALQELTAAGIGATGSYPGSLVDVPQLRSAIVNPADSANGGRQVARRIATLPTHPFVTSKDIARTLDVIQRGNSTACAA